MTIRVGIMGFGRIGRNIFRILSAHDSIEVVAIVDIADFKGMEYLLRYDTVHGRFPHEVRVVGDYMYVRGQQIRLVNAKEPGLGQGRSILPIGKLSASSRWNRWDGAGGTARSVTDP